MHTWTWANKVYRACLSFFYETKKEYYRCTNARHMFDNNLKENRTHTSSFNIIFIHELSRNITTHILVVCILLKGAIEVWYHCFCISLSNISHFHMFCSECELYIDKCGIWRENVKKNTCTLLLHAEEICDEKFEVLI